MKFVSFPSLLVAGALSAALVAPFHADRPGPARPFVFEAALASSAPGKVQIYYDAGGGFQEKASTSADLAAAAEPRLYRLSVPVGTYRQLRFDPIDRDGTVTIASARILDAEGGELCEIPLPQFQARNQIRSLTITGGRLRVEVQPGGDDPQLILRFDPPLDLRSPRAWSRIVRSAAGPAAGVWGALVLALIIADRARPLRRQIAGLGSWFTGHPQGGIAIVAALAAIASCYPVVFLGRSFVSPDAGTLLLYDEMPTLPGYAHPALTEVKGADVGAVMWQQVPQSAIEHRALFRDHELPWWNRYDSAGTPLIGQGQSMFGDPLHALVIAANGAAWAWDLKYIAAKWLFAFGLGLGVIALCRHAAAAWLTAAAAPFFGFFLYRVNHPAFFSLCYSPWPLFCWLRLSERRSAASAVRWSVALIAANAVLLASGTVKEAYLLLFTINFAGAAVVLASAPGIRRKLAALGAMIAGGAMFTALTAPLWYSFRDTLRDAVTSYDIPAAFQIQPGLLLGFFDEAFYRPLSRNQAVFDPAANFLVLGGVLYFLATLRAQFSDRRRIALAAAALLPLAFAFGFIPPAWIVHWPFLGRVFHLDNAFSCALIVLCAVIAGAGYATAARRLGTEDGRADLGIAALLLFGLVFAYVGFGQAVHRSVLGPGATFSVWPPGESLPVSPLLWAYLGLLLAALAGLALVVRRALIRRRLSAGLALAAILCGYILVWRHAQEPPGAAASAYDFRPGQRVDLHARSAAMARVGQAVRSAPGRAIGLQNNFFPGWGGMYGIEGVNGADALMDPRYRELTDLSPLEHLEGWRLYLSRDRLAQARPFLDFLNVRFYFDLRSDQGALGAMLQLVQTGDLDVYESPTAWPRAFYTDRLWRYDQPAELMRQILHGDGRPFAAIARSDLGSAEAPALLPADLPARTVVPAEAYRLTEDSTAFTVEAPAPGLAVLQETGWAGYGHARVDGTDTPLLRLNHAFAGVFLATPGSHRIVVTYRPRHWPTLLILSGGAGLALAASAIASLSRRPSPPRPIPS